MNKKQKSAFYEKVGMASVIADIMWDLNKNSPIYFEGYSYDSDRLSFNFDGHKCRLVAIHRVDWTEKGTIELTIQAKGVELAEWTELTMVCKIHHFRFSTLEKMALEAYAHLGEEAEAEEYVKEHFAGFLDSYSVDDL